MVNESEHRRARREYSKLICQHGKFAMRPIAACYSTKIQRIQWHSICRLYAIQVTNFGTSYDGKFFAAVSITHIRSIKLRKMPLRLKWYERHFLSLSQSSRNKG